jgi:hypothetical protein
MNTLLKYVPETAAAIAALTGQDAAGVAAASPG